MYQVLIVSSNVNGGIYSIVVSFDTEAAANIALANIARKPRDNLQYVTATVLW